MGRRGREGTSSRLPAEWALTPHAPETMTQAEINNGTPNRLSHPGTLRRCFFIVNTVVVVVDQKSSRGFCQKQFAVMDRVLGALSAMV